MLLHLIAADDVVTFVHIYKKHNDFLFLLRNKFRIWAKSGSEWKTISKTCFSNSHLGDLNTFTSMQIVCLKPSIFFFFLTKDLCFLLHPYNTTLYTFFFFLNTWWNIFLWRGIWISMKGKIAKNHSPAHIHNQWINFSKSRGKTWQMKFSLLWGILANLHPHFRAKGSHWKATMCSF